LCPRGWVAGTERNQKIEIRNQKTDIRNQKSSVLSSQPGRYVDDQIVGRDADAQARLERREVAGREPEVAHLRCVRDPDVLEAEEVPQDPDHEVHLGWRE